MKNSVALKLNGIVLLVVLLLGGTMGFFFVTEERALLADELERRIGMLGSSLGRGIEYEKSRNDLAGIDQILQAAALDREIAYVIVKSEDGDIWAARWASKAGGEVVERSFPLHDIGVAREEFLETPFGEAHKPGEKQEVGRIALGVDLSLLEKEQRGLIGRTALFVLSFSMIAASLGFLAVHFMLRTPMASLFAGIRGIGSGDLARRIEVDSRDEFGMVAKAFNEMAERLSATLISKRDLEKVVEERTADLNRALANLEKAARGAERLAERLDLAVRSAHMGIWDWDIRKDEWVWNDRMYELYGLAKEEVPSVRGAWSRALHPGDRDREAEMMQRALLGESDYDSEYWIVLPDGSSRAIKAHGRVTRDGDGAPLRMTGIHYDVTAQRQEEKEKERLQAQLAQAQKLESLGVLAGGIAHDFNNILAAILGYAELSLMESPGNPGLEDNLVEIIRAGTRAKELVEQILVFSRKGQDPVRAVEVAAVVQDTLKLLRSTLPATIELEWEGPAGRVDPVLAAPVQIHQIVMNLCTNAYQAMKSTGGRITCSVGMEAVTERDAPRLGVKTGRYVRLCVADDGPGIPREHLEKIFDPFFTTKPKGEGTGLGLSVVFGIARGRGGTVEVAGAPGKGASFKVLLPAVSGADEAGVESIPGDDRKVTGSVLIVDDDPSLAKLMAMSLARHGLRTQYCLSGAEALGILLADPAAFDAVVTDQTMPGMTGSELLIKARQAKLGIPMLVYTGHSDILDEDSALLMGFSHFLRKPVQHSMLALAIASAIGEKASATGARVG